MPRVDNETVRPAAQSPEQEVRAPSQTRMNQVESTNNSDLYEKLPPEMRHEIMKKISITDLSSLARTSKTARTEVLEFLETDDGEKKRLPYLLNSLTTGKVTLRDLEKEIHSDTLNLLRKKFNNVSVLESIKLAYGEGMELRRQSKSPSSSLRDMSDVTHLIFSHKGSAARLGIDSLAIARRFKKNIPNLKNIKLRDMSHFIYNQFLDELMELNELESMDLSDSIFFRSPNDLISLHTNTREAISGYCVDDKTMVSDLTQIPKNLNTIRLSLSSSLDENEWEIIRNKLAKDGQLKIRNHLMSVGNIWDTPPIRADQIPEDLRHYVTSYQWSEGEDIEHILRILPQLKEVTVNRHIEHMPPKEPIGIPETIDQGIQQALLRKGIQLRIGNTNNDEVYVKNEDGTAFVLADDDNTLFI